MDFSTSLAVQNIHAANHSALVVQRSVLGIGTEKPSNGLDYASNNSIFGDFLHAAARLVLAPVSRDVLVPR